MQNERVGPIRVSLLGAFLLAVLLLATACQGDEEAYPSLVTEMAEGLTDTEGRLTLLVTDGGTSYHISNPQEGLQPQAAYRLMAGYVAEEEGMARLYTLAGVRILRDSTALRRRDTFSVVSVWASPRYLNLHLRALGQGGTHHWGYAVDSTGLQGTYLSLHHHRASGQAAYTADFYASIPWDSLPTGRLILEQRYEFQR